MKKLLLSIMLLLSIVEAKEVGDTKEIIAQYIQAWQPLRMDLNEGYLIIPFNQARITNDIYMSILKNGICASTYLDEKKWSNVKGIGILNKYAKQGYIFKGGYETCKQAGKLVGKEVDLFILSKTNLL